MATLDKTQHSLLTWKNWGYVLALLGTAFYSMKAIFAKLAYGPGNPENLDVDPITILMLRMLFSLPFYIVIGTMAWRERTRDERPLPNIKQTAIIFLVGILGYYLSSYLDFQGLTMITAQFERLLLFTYPFFVVIFGAMFFGGRITLTGLGSLTFAYSGIIFIFFRGEMAVGDYALLGSILVMGAAITFALYQLLAKTLMKEIGSRIFTCLAMSSACIGVIVHYLVQYDLSALLDVPKHIIWICFAIAIISTILPSFMINAALERIGAQAVAAIGILSPIVTIIMAIIILNEPFGLIDAIGSLVVVGGVGLYTWLDTKENKKQ